MQPSIVVSSCLRGDRLSVNAGCRSGHRGKRRSSRSNERRSFPVAPGTRKPVTSATGSVPVVLAEKSVPRRSGPGVPPDRAGSPATVTRCPICSGNDLICRRTGCSPDRPIRTCSDGGALGAAGAISRLSSEYYAKNRYIILAFRNWG